MNLPNLQPFIFRNYDFAPEIQSHYLGSCKYRMWESIRASGAAPGYFEEYVLDDYLHQVMTIAYKFYSSRLSEIHNSFSK